MLGAIISLITYLLLSGFFSGMEMAFISSSKLKVELSKSQGKLAGKALAYFMKNPSQFIGTYLVGNNIALVLFSASLGAIVNPFIEWYLPEKPIVEMLAQVFLGTIIILIFGEYLPKLLFRLRADKLLHYFALPFTGIYILLYLPVLLVNFLTKGLIRLFFGINIKESAPVFSEVDLEHYIKETMYRSQDDEVDAVLLENALELRDVKVRECMIPRPEVVAIDVKRSIDYLRSTIIETGFSKILIYEEDIDNILGYVHHFDLHNKPTSIRSIIKPIPFVPETMLAQTLMTEFKHTGRSIALVVDEYGGTAGIITFEDVLEEIFGEIKDEHDDDEFIEQQLSKTDFLFSGRLEIDYLNENYSLNLPEAAEYETLSGYIIHLMENIPEREEVINTEHFEFTILNVSNTKIETVKLKIKS